jgi:enoyl-CoA hydratase/carnithine racemase
MIRGSEMTLEDGLRLEELLMAHALSTEDAREGVRAFAEKRKPQYKAR